MFTMIACTSLKYFNVHLIAKTGRKVVDTKKEDVIMSSVYRTFRIVILIFTPFDM